MWEWLTSRFNHKWCPIFRNTAMKAEETASVFFLKILYYFLKRMHLLFLFSQWQQFLRNNSTSFYNKSLEGWISWLFTLTFPVPPVSVQTCSWPHEGILLSASYHDTCMFYICCAVEAKTKIKTLHIKKEM